MNKRIVESPGNASAPKREPNSLLARWRQAWRESLRFRLLALGLMPLLIAFPIIVAILVLIGGGRTENLLASNVRGNLAGASNYLEQVKAEAGSRISQLVKSERLLHLVVEHPDSPELKKLLNTTAKGSGLDFLVVATQEGVVLATSTGAVAGMSLPDSYVVRQAGIGIANAAFERVNVDDLRVFSPDFPALVMQRGVAPSKTWGLLINAAAHFPLSVHKADVILIGGILVNNNAALIEHMREIIFPVGVLPGDAEGTTAVYLDDQVVAISRQHRQNGHDSWAPLDFGLRQSVIERGDNWLGTLNMGDVSHRVGFAPLADGEGRRIGMVGVGIPDAPYRRETLLLFGSIAALMALTMLGLSMLFLRAGRELTQRLDDISDTMLGIQQGHSSARVKASGMGDEVSRLEQHFNSLLDTIAEQNALRRDALQTIADEASRRRAIFEHERDGVLILNSDGSVFEANPKAAAMLGYGTDELVGMKVSAWDNFLGADTMPGLLGGLGQEGYFYETEHRRRDGTCYAAEVSISRADWADRTFILLVQRDISERKVFESELEKYRSSLEGLVEQRTRELNDRSEQLKTIFALSPDGFVSFDQHRRINLANRSFTRMTGIGEDALLGMDESAFSAHLAALSLPSALFPGLPALRAGRLAQDAESEPEEVVAGKRRQLFELKGPGNRVLEVGIRMSESPGVSQILYFRDVTYETEVDRMKSEFLSTAAHELRTPMSSIYGFSQLLLLKQFERERSQEMLGTIVRQSELMISIINELLDLARIEARRGKDFEIKRLLLLDVVQEVVAGYNLPAGRQAPVIVEPDGELFINADHRKMLQALLNILSNAYKYSPAGGAVTITLLGSMEGELPRVGVQIQDEGIGMTPEQLARIFERFYRADASGNIPGTGLGMSVVKEIVELHGGEVRVASSHGAGTTVTICLPAARQAENALPGLQYGADLPPPQDSW